MDLQGAAAWLPRKAVSRTGRGASEVRGHIHKRGSTWTAVYDEGYDEHGRRRQRSKGGFPTRREAQAFLSDVLARLGDGSYAQPSKQTLGDYLTQEWLPAIESTIRPMSFEQYEKAVRLRILPRLGGHRLQTVTPAHLNALYRELEQAGLSVSTRRTTHAVLSRAFKDAIRWGKAIRNPARLAEPPSMPRTRVEAWSAKELMRFLEFTQDDRYAPSGASPRRRGCAAESFSGSPGAPSSHWKPSERRAAATPAQRWR